MASDSTQKAVRRVAAIDIGTNTILMLIAERGSGNSLVVLRDEHSIGRLGKGVDAQKNILPETFERVLRILRTYRGIAEEYSVDAIVACGTSALRDAANQQSFLTVVREELGINIQVISGETEAQLTYRGALAGWADTATSSFAVLDIGGGSTELSYGKGLTLKESRSIDIGAVRITERLLHTSPPSATAIEEAQLYIQKQVASYPLLPPNTQLVAVAGTPTTLAAYVQQLDRFDATKIHQYTLTFTDILRAYNELRVLSLEELHRIPSIHPDRADILLAGIIILMAVMKRYTMQNVLVSTQGLRYGIAHNVLFNGGNLP